MGLTAEVTQGIRKGALFLMGNEFTLQFDAAYVRTHWHEYQVLLENLKKLRQLTFDDRRGWWTIPVTDASIACLQQLVEWGVTPTTEARKKLGVVLKKQAEEKAAIAAKSEENVELILPHAPELNEAMKNYQKIGVLFLAKMMRAFLGDEMGLGKSLQVLAAFEKLEAYPVLILCPVKLKQNWIKECLRWLPHRSASTQAKVFADITVLGYSEAHKYVNYGLVSTKKKEKEEAKKMRDEGKRFFFPDFVRLKGVALDEGHFCKVSSSRRTMSSLAIAKHCESPVRFVLSGTPIENKNSEMIAPMTFLGVMERMGGWYHIATRYCGMVRTRFGVDLKESTNSIEFHRKCCENFYLRRTKKEVLPELPDKIQTVVDVEIDNDEEYRSIERDIVTWTIERTGKLMNRDQIDAQQLMKLGALRESVAKGKLAWILEWANDFLESGEKLILFGFHRVMLDGLVRGLKEHNPASILGGCLDVNKEIEKFQKDKTCRVCVMSIVSAGFGVNGLQNVCSHVAITELMWTHAKHLNAIDRLHRIGQKECVNAYYLLASGTIDDDMWSLNSEKDKIVTATVDGDEVPPANALVNLVRKYSTRN